MPGLTSPQAGLDQAEPQPRWMRGTLQYASPASSGFPDVRLPRADGGEPDAPVRGGRGSADVTPAGLVPPRPEHSGRPE
jgi:hypothetical protein